MFFGLKIKIRSLVILTFSLCFILIGVISYTIIRTLINDNFVDLSVKSINQNVSNVQIYMRLIEETSKQVSVNRDIIASLKNTGNNDLREKNYITTALENVKQTHFGVLGAVLFHTSGNISISNSISEYPSLETLKKNKVIGGFMASDSNTTWIVRNDDIAGYYDNTYYNGRYGVVTFASKLFDDENKLQGYLFIDIDPHYFYQFFKFSYANSSDLSVICMANSQVGILPSKLYSSIDPMLTKEILSNLGIRGSYKTTSDNKYLIVYNDFCSNSKIIIAIPRTSLSSKLGNIMVILALVIILLIGISIFIGVILTDSISRPLTDLYGKMRNSSV